MVATANRTPRVVAINWAKKAVKLALLGPAMIGRDDGPGLFVLIYHRVGAGQGREMDMPVRRFARQMRELTGRGALVGLREGLDRLSAGDLQEDLVAVTFDDGYHEVYEHAWPILRDLRVPATVFLPTAFTEGSGPPPIRSGAANRGAPARPLSWEEVGEMASTGLLTVGSHSVTHTDFDRLSRAQADEEAGASRALLESRTGTTVDLFAYPRAVVAHDDVVASHYRYAVAADGAKNRSGRTDPRRVMRTPVRDSDGMFFFRRRLEGMRPLEDRLYANLRGRAP
jgi:peptidoglycan/xylan/chitin deacetylase (PgdA/CDA1 family)